MTREAMERVQLELVSSKRLTEILFGLIEQICTILGEDLQQHNCFNSTLDAVIAQLELRDSKMECMSLQQQNERLRQELRRAQSN
jgi:hypothetical protein